MRLVLAAVLATLFSGTLYSQTRPEIDESLHDAVQHLVNSQLPSGLFVYELDGQTGDAYRSADPEGMVLVRQAFAAYALSEYVVRHADIKAEAAIRKFLGKAAGVSIPIGKDRIQRSLEATGLYSHHQLWGLLEAPFRRLGLLYVPEGDGLVLSPNGNYADAYPGATALSLAAAVNYRLATGDAQFDAIQSRWARGLIALYVGGRGFREAPDRIGESSYVNGQGWLALSMYHRLFPGDALAGQVVTELDRILVKRYRSSISARFFHWGSMAALKRYRELDNPVYPGLLASLNQAFFSFRSGELKTSGNSCHLIEGFSSYLSIAGKADPSGSLVRQVRLASEYLLRQNLRLQVRSVSSGQARGGFKRGTDTPVVRLDHTAHCLNALLIFQDQL